MAIVKLIHGLVIFALFSFDVSVAYPGFGFGWGSNGPNIGRTFSTGLFPQFYQFSCPQADEIVMTVLEKAIARDPRMAASLLRLHFHDCFVQVSAYKSLDLYFVFNSFIKVS